MIIYQIMVLWAASAVLFIGWAALITLALQDIANAIRERKGP